MGGWMGGWMDGGWAPALQADTLTSEPLKIAF